MKTNGSKKLASANSNKPLKDLRVAILVCDGFEESEMTKPRQALQKAGALVDLITPKAVKVKGWRNGKWTKAFKVDKQLEKVKSTEYDALLLPGGVMNPDKLRTNLKAVNFVKDFFAKKKPIAAICHGPLTLIESGKLKGRKMTSYHSIKTDIINAGAKWEDKEVVVDKQLVTSRQPKDIPAFNKAMINVFSKVM